jgi:hypothetical protein
MAPAVHVALLCSGPAACRARLALPTFGAAAFLRSDSIRVSISSDRSQNIE